MTNQEQQIELCEWMGWKRTKPIGQSKYPTWKHPDGRICTLVNLPNTNSLDVLHEMEKKLIDMDKNCPEYEDPIAVRYTYELLKLVATWKNDFSWSSVCNADFYKVATATAAQRREALLKTLNLWRQSPQNT